MSRKKLELALVSMNVESARRLDELMKIGLSMLPLVVAKFIGSREDTNVCVRDTAMIKFLEDLSQDEFMRIMEALPPVKRLAMLELYKSYAKEKRSGDVP